VALIGADGAGKSAVASRLATSLPVPAVAVYMGENPEAGGAVLPTTRWLWRRRAAAGAGPVPGAPPPPGSRVRRSAPARLLGAPRTGLLLLNQLVEETWRWRAVRRQVRRGQVVVLDRSLLHDYWFYDVVGPHRSPVQRVHGWWLRRVLDRPELTICLDAPAETLYARKPEGGLDNLRRRREEYLRLAHLTEAFHVVDVTAPLDDVVAEAAALVMAHADRGRA
jgi:hypothetical protein